MITQSPYHTQEQYAVYGGYCERKRQFVALDAPVVKRGFWNDVVEQDGRFYRVMLNAWREPYLKDVTDEFTAVLAAADKGASGWTIGDSLFFTAVFNAGVEGAAELVEAVR